MHIYNIYCEQHKDTIRQAYACIHRYSTDSIHCSSVPLFAYYRCKTAIGLDLSIVMVSYPDTGDQRYSSVQTCAGDKVSPFIPQTLTPTQSPILSDPLITHTHALKWQKRKMLCMQNRRAAHTRVRESWTRRTETEEVEINVRVHVCTVQRACLCVIPAHFVVYESSLKLLKIAYQSCVRI